MKDDEPYKVVFLPGCFDNFDGTQEELEEMIAAIEQMASSGEIFENSNYISEGDLEDLPLDIQEQISAYMEAYDEVDDAAAEATLHRKNKLN